MISAKTPLIARDLSHIEYIIDYKNPRGDVHRYPKDEDGGRNKVLSITDMDAKRQITTNNATQTHALGDL